MNQPKEYSLTFFTKEAKYQTKNYSMKLFTSILSVFLISCTPKQSNTKASENPERVSPVTAKVLTGFHKLEKLFVVGDFDGDKKADTIYQYNFSKLKKKEIVFAPDPMKTDWDEVSKWFYDQDSDVNLTLNKKNSDILHLGTAQGLYCLINIGDTNKDGNDEIALVIDKCDQSQTNTCKIYSLCEDKWQLLKEFGIHEDAFDFTGTTAPKFTEIKEYLELKKNGWVFRDYNQQEYDSPEEVGKMKPLKIQECK